MKKIFLVGFLLFALAACSPATPEIVKETVIAEQTVISEVTREVTVEVTKEVEVTRLVEITSTPLPSPTATLTPEPESGDGKFSVNYLPEFETGGLTIQIARVVVANKSEVPQEWSSSFDEIDVVGELIFIITNTSDKTISIYPDQGSVQINDELIDLLDYFGAHFGDSVGGEIPPGVKKIGGFWFGIKRSELADILSMTVRFNGPHDQDFNRTGEDVELVIDLAEHTWNPIPDDLADALR